MKTSDNFFQQIKKFSADHKDWRKGQIYFNALNVSHPELAEEIRGSKFDPFYKDEIILDFIEFLKERGVYETE